MMGIAEGPETRGIVVVVLAWLTVGCGSTPPVRSPEIDIAVPAGWTAEQAASEVATSTTPMLPADGIALADTLPGQHAWWHSFGDARLDSLIAESLVSNYDLQAAVARVDAAGARARMAGADQWPTLDVALNGNRRKQSFIGFPVGGAPGMPEAPGGDGDEPVSSLTTSYGLSFSAGWELDLWGRIRAGKVAALADREAAAAELEAARLSLAAQTARAWFGATEAALQLRLAESTAQSYEEAAAWVRTRYERGLRPSLDLRLALSSLASAEATSALRRQQLDGSIRQLEVLLGRYPAARLAIADTLGAVPPPIPAGLPAELLTRRPDLIAAERRLVAADARLAEAWRAQFPRLKLTGSAGTSAIDLQDLVDTDFSVWSIAANLAQPLFQGGRLRANVALARAGTREALAGYSSQLLRAFAEVESALVAEEFLAERERELAIATEQSVAARRLAESRYASGLEAYVTVLESQRREFINRASLLSVQRQRLEARVNLHLALGGGFDIGPEPAQAAVDTDVELAVASATDTATVSGSNMTQRSDDFALTTVTGEYEVETR